MVRIMLQLVVKGEQCLEVTKYLVSDTCFDITERLEDHVKGLGCFVEVDEDDDRDDYRKEYLDEQQVRRQRLP